MNNQVIEKIKKILKLANGAGASQGEIEAAMAKAKEVAMRYNIDLASVDVGSEDELKASMSVEKDSSLRTRSKYKQPYHDWLFAVLEGVFSVKIIQTVHNEYNGKRISALHIIGETVDVAICKEVYPWLEKVFPRTLSKAVSQGILTYSAADTNGCYSGLYSGIIEVNRQEEEKLEVEDKNRYALVVKQKDELVQEKLQEEFPHLKYNKARARQYNPFAADYGRREGRKINLNQVGAGSPASRLN